MGNPCFREVESMCYEGKGGERVYRIKLIPRSLRWKVGNSRALRKGGEVEEPSFYSELGLDLRETWLKGVISFPGENYSGGQALNKGKGWKSEEIRTGEKNLHVCESTSRDCPNGQSGIRCLWHVRCFEGVNLAE